MLLYGLTPIRQRNYIGVSAPLLPELYLSHFAAGGIFFKYTRTAFKGYIHL